jgi:hypothetical protein
MACGKPGINYASTTYRFDDPYAHHTQAGLDFSAVGNLQSSVRAFEAAAHFHGDAEDLNNFAVALMRIGAYKHALPLLRQARSMDSSSLQVAKNVRTCSSLVQQTKQTTLRSPVCAHTKMETADVGAATVEEIKQNRSRPSIACIDPVLQSCLLVEYWLEILIAVYIGGMYLMPHMVYIALL